MVAKQVWAPCLLVPIKRRESLLPQNGHSSCRDNNGKSFSHHTRATRRQTANRTHGVCRGHSLRICMLPVFSRPCVSFLTIFCVTDRRYRRQVHRIPLRHSQGSPTVATKHSQSTLQRTTGLLPPIDTSRWPSCAIPWDQRAPRGCSVGEQQPILFRAHRAGNTAQDGLLLSR